MLLTLLRVPLTHTLTTTTTTLDSSQNTIHIGCSAPLLVREHVHAEFLLARLDQPHVGEHTFILEGAREFRGDGGVGVQAGEGDELEDEAVCVNLIFHIFICEWRRRTHAEQDPR